MAVKGIFSSDASITTDRAGDFASAILQIFPTGTAPMFALSAGMKTYDATDTLIHWFEENRYNGRVAIIGNNGAPVGGNLIADDASFVVQGDIYLVEATGEYLYVLGVTGNQLVVSRGFGATGTAPIAPTGVNDPAYLQRIGSAFEEGSEKPLERSLQGAQRFNYMQIFRNSWGLTNTAAAVSYRTGDKQAKTKSDCMMIHAEDMERSIIWGVQDLGVRNNQPFRTMDGVLNQIKTNNFVAPGGVLTKVAMDSLLEAVFSHNVKGQPNERIAFAGNNVIQVLNQLIFHHSGTIYNMTVRETEFGIRVNTWITPFGEITILTHPLMNENPVWRNELYVFHPGALELAYLRRTSADDDDKAGSRQGRDSNTGVLTTEMTCAYKGEITGAVMRNIQRPGV